METCGLVWYPLVLSSYKCCHLIILYRTRLSGEKTWDSIVKIQILARFYSFNCTEAETSFIYAFDIKIP